MSMRAPTGGDYLPAEYSTAAETDAPFSVIDRHSTFDGTFRSTQDLRIDGEAKGTIHCDGTLLIAEGATVEAEVNAENVTVAGDVQGEINCRGKLHMLPSGRVHGKIATTTLVIAEGAYYEGELTMVKPEERDQPRRVTASASAPVPINGQAAEVKAAGSPTTFIRRLGSPETPWDQRPEAANEPPAAAQPPTQSTDG